MFKKALISGLISTSFFISSFVYANNKEIIFAVASTLETLDPHNTNSTLNQAVGKSYYEGLFEFDKDLKLQNKLALDYKVSENGLIYTFKLRPNIKFHDGTDFNSEAVKINFDRVKNPANKLARFSQFSMIDKVEIIDELTLKIILKSPYSPFINNLAHSSAMIISPTALKKYKDKIHLNPVGTGPFKVVEWKPAEYLKVKKFDNYWQKDKPKIDSLIFKFVTDGNTRASAMQTGEAHFSYPLAFEQASKLMNNPKLEVIDNGDSIMTMYLSMNVSVKPFDNLKVRQAINYAINKQALIKVVYNGYAKESNGVVPQGVEFAHKIGYWEYNPKKAKQLLREAGYPNGFETTLWAGYNNSTAIKMSQFLQQQLAQVGIKVSVEILEPGQRIQKVQAVQNQKDAKVRLYVAGWSASTGEANWGLNPLFSTNAFPPIFNNVSYYSNNKVDELLEEALLTTDKKTKTKIYKEAQEIIWQDVPWAYLVNQGNVYVKSKNLSGVYVMPDANFWFNDIKLQD